MNLRKYFAAIMVAVFAFSSASYARPMPESPFQAGIKRATMSKNCRRSIGSAAEPSM